MFALLLRPTKYTHDSSYDHTSAKAHPPHHSQKSVNSSSASSRQSISVVHVNQQKALPREQHQPVAPLAGQDRIGQSLNHHNYIYIYIYNINKYIYNIYNFFTTLYIVNTLVTAFVAAMGHLFKLYISYIHVHLDMQVPQLILHTCYNGVIVSIILNLLDSGIAIHAVMTI